MVDYPGEAGPAHQILVPGVVAQWVEPRIG